MQALSNQFGFVRVRFGMGLLAAMAMISASTAQATTIAGFGLSSTSNCFTTVEASTCETQQVSTQGGDPNGNWVALSSSTITAQSGSAGLNATGSASGLVVTGEVIPVSWDFFITGNGSSDTASWQLIFELDGPQTINFARTGNFVGNVVAGPNSAQTSASGDTSFTDGSSTEITGSGFLNIGNSFDSNPSLGSYFMSLAVSSTSNTSGFTVLVPGGATLDFNSVTPAPEPASIMMAGIGAGALLLARKKLRA